MGSSRERPLCGILRVQRRPSGLRGATTELAWRLGPVSRLRFHRPVSVLPHRRRPRHHHITHGHIRDADGTFSKLDGEQPLATQRGKPLVVQQLALRRPVPRPVVLGMRQMAMGFGLVVVTAVGALVAT